MSEPPEKVTVCGQTFSVEWDSREVGRLVDQNENRDDLGTVMVAQQRIVLREHQGPHSQRDALLHEVIHAIQTMTGNDEYAKQAEIERVVGATAVALLAFLRDNPGAVQWLTDEL